VRIHFFTSAGEPGATAFGLAAVRHPEHDWRKLVLHRAESRADFEASREPADLIVSFLNPYIVPPDQLEEVGRRAYNVHPAPPDYPGNDSPHFAAYDGHFVAGATLNRMEPAVDCGEIYDVWEAPVDPAGGVAQLREVSRQLSLGILLENLPAMLDDALTPSGREWTLENKRSREDFKEMCRIDPSVDGEELERLLAAFYHPDYRNKPFVELHGRRFVFDPNAR
jgi:methionyl-tRNA formyltransferase